MKHSAQIATLSAQRLAYGSMPSELAETRLRSNFPESRNALSKERSAKLNTDVTILMPTSTSTQIPNQKGAKKKNPKSAVNNTVNKLILDRRSCEKLHKNLSLPTQFS